MSDLQLIKKTVNGIEETAIRVECLQCAHIEYLDPEDYHPGIPYFCTSRCQETYEYESDPNNFSNPEYEG